MIALEIAVTAPAGARVAAGAGADRVELCSALELGGLTPSDALVAAVAATGLPTHVLVRCRPGDFCYDADEVALMAAEVRAAVAAGASGVVVGALTTDGALDTAAVRRFVDAAGPVEVTLHRAVDQTADPVAAAAAAYELGVRRVLTSGGAAVAADGVATIGRMVRAVPGIEVMAGGGVRPADVARLADAGVAAVHLSAKRPAPARPGAAWVPLGAAADSATHFVTDPAVVAAADTARRR
ncbi:MAG TPA: copper homeostasis protein CutC [Actinocatenispora sp.]